MKIYIDYIFLINFVFDFILLISISYLLKRNVKVLRIIIGSIIGGLSIFILFIRIPSLVFFFLKILSGILMVIVTFKYKDLKYTLNNFFYLMILSIILGGFLYLINIEVGYEHVGMIFYMNGENLNIFILMLFAILIMIIYVKKIKSYQNKINYYHKVIIYTEKSSIFLNGYIDTGNNLIDPYFNKPVLIVNPDINISSDRFIFVPFNTLNSKGMLKCFLIDKIYIDGVGYKYNCLVGKSFDKIKLSGIDIILNNKIMEEWYEKIIIIFKKFI